MSIVSIDYGNHSTKIYNFYNGVFKNIMSPTGNTTIPSRIVFCKNNRLFGDFSIYSNKSLYNNLKSKLFDEFNIYNTKIKYLTYQEQDIDQLFLTYMYINNIVKHIHFNLKKSVIPDLYICTFPDYIHHDNVKTYKILINECGIKKNMLIPESIAIGLDHGLYKLMNNFYNTSTNILFIDIGQVHVSFYLINYHKREMKVIFKWFIEDIGASRIDKELTRFLYDIFVKKYNIEEDCHQDKDKIMKKIYYNCENFRKSLNTNKKIQCNIEALWKDYNLQTIITRDDYYNCVKNQYNKFRNSLIVFKHNFKINSIELLGGLSRFYIYNEILQELYNKSLIKTTLNREECIAKGGTIYGANSMTLYKNIDIKIKYKYQYSNLYIKVDNRNPVLLISREDYIPLEKNIKLSTKINKVEIYEEGNKSPLYKMNIPDKELKVIVGFDLIHHFIYKSILNNRIDELNDTHYNHIKTFRLKEVELNKLDIEYHDKQTLINNIEEHIFDFKNKGKDVEKLERWLNEKSIDSSLKEIKDFYHKIKEK